MIYPLKSKGGTPFWEGLTRGVFLLQKCRECREVFFPPRLLCPECLSGELSHVEAKGTGTLYAFTEVHVPMEGFEAPYILGCIDLDEHPGRFLSRITAPIETLRIGMKVRVHYVQAAEDLVLHTFVPDE